MTYDFQSSLLVNLKDQDFLDRLRIAGKVAADCLVNLEKLVNEKTNLSMLELSRLTEDFILTNKCLPTFKGYKGFPEAVCISVNNTLVHGIPTNYKLQEGDLVSFDLGATFEGAIADTAITCIYGEPKKKLHVDMIKCCSEALDKAINYVAVGKRLDGIGNVISKTGKSKSFGVVNNYGGHGICCTEDGHGIAHAAPFVQNKGSQDEGIRIQPGMVLAIEPLFTLGGIHTFVDKNSWDVKTDNLNCHWEHTIFVKEDGIELITRRN
jgi:methionyl aminopeptidase